MEKHLFRKEKPLFRKCAKAIVVAAVLIQLSMGSYYIAKWFLGIVSTYYKYLALPREDRIFTTTLDEYYCILNIRKNLPEDANILWIPETSVFVNYYTYPRKHYYAKPYTSQKEFKIDREFLESRNINYVLSDLDKIHILKKDKKK